MLSVLEGLGDRLKACGAGLECGKGWISILVNLDKELAKLDPDYKIQQVKEKFGFLRYYCSGNWDWNESYDLIYAAEVSSGKTCEECGSTDTITRSNDGYWIKTLCPVCREQWNKDHVS